MIRNFKVNIKKAAIIKQLLKDFIIIYKKPRLLVKKSKISSELSSTVSTKKRYSLLKILLYEKHFKSISVIEIDKKTNTLELEHFNGNYKKNNISDERIFFERDLEQIKKSLFSEGYGFIELSTSTEVAFLNQQDPEIQGFHSKIAQKNPRDVAFYEYLERVCSVIRPPVIIKEFYDKLNKEDVINPHKIGFTWANDDVFSYTGEEMEWVESFSLFNKKKKLLPLQYAYYNAPNIINRFILGNSNGCALGSSPEEAILHGLLEFIERDVFINYWFYDRYPIYELDCSEIPEISNFYKYMNIKGYKLQFFYIDDNSKTYTVWCLIRNFKDNNIYSITGLACKFDLLKAINASYKEVCGVIHVREKEKNLNAKIKEIERNPNITNLDSIIYFYSSEKLVKDQFDYILSDVEKVQFSAIQKSTLYTNTISGDLTNLLDSLVKKYEDILTVDQTPTFLKEKNLFCYKVTCIGGLDIQFIIDNNHKPVNQYKFPIMPIA